MTNFFEKLKNIKKMNDGKILEITYENYKIELKLVDMNSDTIDLLYNLRKKYRDMFATDFVMTKEKTKQWIKKDILENRERALFIIYVNGEKIGCIGNGGYYIEKNSSRLDNMMKDPTCKIRGIMTIIEKVYLKWMFDYFQLSKITGYLFSDNEKMMIIHKRCGWVLLDKVSIKKTYNEKGSIWEIDYSNQKNSERFFNIIELTKKDLMENFNDIEYKECV